MDTDKKCGPLMGIGDVLVDERGNVAYVIRTEHFGDGLNYVFNYPRQPKEPVCLNVASVDILIKAGTWKHHKRIVNN